MENTTQEAELVQRVAALDVGKAELVACVRVPHERDPRKRRQEVRTYPTSTVRLGGGPITSIEDPARQEDRRTLAERYLGAEGATQYLEPTKDVADTMVLVRVRPERWYTRDYSKG